MTDDSNKKLHDLMAQLADLKGGHANELDARAAHLQTSIGEHR